MENLASRIELQEITLDDLSFIHRLHSNPKVDEYNTLGIPESKEVTRTFIQSLLDAKNIIPQSRYCWVVRLLNTKEEIGICGFTLSNDRFNKGEIYYNLAPEHWGVGYATEIAKELIKFGFNEFKLHRIEAGVAVNNARSIKVLKKAGMAQEGRRRQILPIRGQWVDNFHFAIIESDIKEQV